ARTLPQVQQTPGGNRRVWAQLAQAFNRDGVVVVKDLITPEQAEIMRAHLQDKPRFGDSVHRYFDQRDILETPGIMELINDSRLLEMVAEILGCKPTLSEVSLWWLYHDYDPQEEATNHTGYASYPLEYHRDIDNWRVVRVFLYLTDVDAESGPHSYLRGTQMMNLPIFRRVNLAPNQPLHPLLQRRLDITGQAGTLIIMDPFGLHRAIVPKTQDRLMLAFSYSLHRVPATPEHPVLTLPPRPDLDPYINRSYLRFEAVVSNQ
ncbi:MAG: phytanoyl-CoA dioxygenase family protein, partial [Nodosilinea sp.]